MPSIPKIQQLIHESEPGDWVKQEGPFGTLNTADPHQVVWVYEHDVDLRIERGDTAVEEFDEEWTNFPNNENNASYEYWVFYGSSPIERQMIVAVDGYRASIPLPDRPNNDGEPWTISEYQYRFGQIVNHDYTTYSDYLGRAGIEVKG